MTVAVIADIIGSRQLPDRAGAQRGIEAAIDRVQRDAPAATVRLSPTVGDEFQGVYGSLAGALGGVLLLQLALPDEVQLRFGLGVGEVGTIDGSAGGVPDGPGWWAARRGIDAVESMQQRTMPNARSYIVADTAQAKAIQHAVTIANAYLAARDEVVTAMNDRARRLTYGRCVRRTQRELAAEEGISQSAVSQALAGAGAAGLVAGFRTLEEGSGR